MFGSTLSIAAASSLFALSFAAPIPSNAGATRSLEARAAYVNYGGDGSTSKGWPAESAWASFDKIWSGNLDIMKTSCKQSFGVADNTEEELSAIKSGLESAAQQSGVDKRFLLSVMIQESKGCVRAPTTNYGQNNPGLMQSFNGEASCAGSSSCSNDEIEKMILEGAGIGRDFGLKQAIAQSNANDVSKYYKGARIYNSGSVDGSGNLGAGIATHCYATDIANRVTGVVFASSPCNEETIGSLQTSEGGGSSNNSDDNETETPAPTQTPTQNETPATTPAPSTEGTGPQEQEEPEKEETTTPTSSTSSDAPKVQGADPNCKKWFTPSKGDSCDKAGIDFAKFRSLNPMLDEKCSNMWAGYQYCIAN